MRSVRLPSLLAGVVTAVLLTAGLPAGPAAAAAVPEVTAVTAHDAPDGVFVSWAAPPDGQFGGWDVERTVDGVSTVLRANLPLGFADHELAPGQSATYRVRGLRGSDVGDWSAPSTGRRDAVGWSPAPGARTLAFSSLDDPDPDIVERLPVTDTSPEVGLAPGNLTSLGGVLVSRIPGPGTYALDRDPAASELALDVSCGADRAPHGSLRVHEIVYGASGGPLSVAADLAYECPDVGTHRVVVRYASAVPTAHVVADVDSTVTTLLRGGTARVGVLLRNTGDAPATLGAVSTTALNHTPVAEQDCVGVVLQAGATCTVHVDVTGASSPAPTGEVRVGVTARVAGQPTAEGYTTIRLLDPPTAPSLSVRAVATGAVELAADPGEVDMGEVLGTVVERRVGAGPWVTVTDVPLGLGVVDAAAPAGQRVTYRAALVLDAGPTPWSSSLEVDVPTESLYTAADGRIEATGSAGDLDHLVLPTDVGAPVRGVAAHPDRRHLVVTTRSASGTRMVLTDLAGRTVREVRSGPSTAALLAPRVSPDGRLVASSTEALAPRVEVTDLATGAVSVLLPQGHVVGWSPDGRRILIGPGRDGDGRPRDDLAWVQARPAAGPQAVEGVAGTSGVGTATSVPPAAVSARGDVAWYSSTLRALRVLRHGASAPVTVASDACAGWPMWSPAGDRLAISRGPRSSCAAGDGTFVAPWPATGTPSTWTRMALPLRALGSTWVSTGSAAPAVTVTPPAMTSGSPAIPFTAADPDDAPGGLAVTCRVDGGTWVACASPWRPTGLATGSHRVEVRAVDPAGGAATAAATWRVDATAPAAPSAGLPASLVGTTSTLRWSGADTGGAGVGGFELRSRSASATGAFSAWTTLPAARATTTARTVVPRSSGTTCYAVRTRDAVGNLGAWSATRCVSTVVDDRSLTRTGGSRTTSGAAWKGTLTSLAGTRSSLTLAKVSSTRVGVLVRTCARCGSLDVFVGSVKVGRLSTKSSATRNQQLLWVPSGRLRSGTLTLRPASGSPVVVDGVVLLR